MSIPLVQNNEKDSINTSIIAIKRNIERINMLLGLSNSEEIDTSKFATKDELQQAVTELQPVDEVTVDNMHSVTSNAVAKSLSYSTTEQKTGGKWIDGKPIYKKTIQFNMLNGVVSIGNLNIDKVVQMNGIITHTSGNIVTFPYYYSAENNCFVYMMSSKTELYCYYQGSWNTSAPVELTIEYTKTTD